MGIVATRAPDQLIAAGSALDGRTYGDVVQDMVDWVAYAQTDTGYGRGGWDYNARNNSGSRSDNSISGYPVLGLRYAEAELYDFESTIPAFVKDELNIWINYIQTTTPGTNFGGSGYTHPNYYVNLLKTGNLLFQMAFVGDTTSTPRVQNTISYIENHWNDANHHPGWKNAAGYPHLQSAYCLMKGLASLDINEITVGGSPLDWFVDDMSTAIVANQSPDGSWPGDPHGDAELATLWALLTLERVAPPAPGLADLCPLEYRWSTSNAPFEWDPFPMVFRSWNEVMFVNNGPDDAFNVTATIICAPPNVTVLDGTVTLGDIPVGGAAWSGDDFSLAVDMTNPQDPSLGIVWMVEYDDPAGFHHVVEGVPKFCGEEANCGIDGG
jgi:hypothetical protein